MVPEPSVQLRIVLPVHRAVDPPAAAVPVIRVGNEITDLRVQTPGAAFCESITDKVCLRDTKTGQLSVWMEARREISGLHFILIFKTCREFCIKMEVRVGDRFYDGIVFPLQHWPGRSAPDG